MSRFHPSVSWNSFDGSKDDSAKSDQRESQSSWNATQLSSFVSDEEEQSSGFHLQNARAGLRSPQTFFVPIHYEANYKYPLIVWLHSDGFNENQVDHVMPHVSTRNYLATGVRGTRAADSVGHRFDWHNSVSAVDAAHEKVLCAIDEVADRYAVHSSRIILAGYQTGGTMAMRIAMRDPERFAAVVSLGGRMPQGGHTFANLDAIRERALPMLWQWGGDNPNYSQESLTEDIRQAMLLKAKVEIRQYNDDDEMNTAALSDLNDWIMSRVVLGESMNDSQRWDTSPVCFSAN